VDAFGADYLDLYAHRDDCAATAEVAGLLPRLRTAPGPVLDAACGNGRHLAALRAAGLTAAGFDYSPALLAVARSRPQAVGRLARGDLRRPPFAGGWGAVLLLFTAFGYFDDTANAACLAALARLLAPGGWLLLDLPDPAQVRATLVAESSRTTPAGHRVRERRRLEGTWVVKDVAYGCGGQERRWQERVRLYEPDEIAALVAAAGLTLAERWPSLRGPVHDDHRHVVWCQAAPGPPWTDALASAAAG
jgi:SAM-dependent methyltransferase